MPKTTSPSIIRTLFTVFIFSTLLLIASIVVSILSIRKLTEASFLVNNTTEVLVEAENFVTVLKDAEGAQRAYLITRNQTFREKLLTVKEKLIFSYSKLKVMTKDNPHQQKRLESLIDDGLSRFGHVIKMVKMLEAGVVGLQSTDLQEQIYKGNAIMDRARKTVDEIMAEENQLLAFRTGELNKYVKYTPFTVVFAALISIIITVSSFLRIRREIQDRMERQREEQERYDETSERIGRIERVTKDISAGNYEVRSNDHKEDELGRISVALNNMLSQLQRNMADLTFKNWIETESLHLSNALRGHLNTSALGDAVLGTLSESIEITTGAFYTPGPRGFCRAAMHACESAPELIEMGKGLAGQALKDNVMKVMQELPPAYLQVSSATGNTAPVTVVILPLSFNHEVVGLLELGFLHKPEEQVLMLLQNIRESLGIAVNNCMTFKRMSELLEETQALSEEMQAQRSELENLNAELEAESQKLQASEEELRVQQEELQQTNGELEERGALLQEKNIEVQKKADELAQSTRYKSEFLANMSHELRTPLNSILLLSRLLYENTNETLNDEEREYARVIQNSGQGLLGLIDEILDLSMIEAGKMEMDFTEVTLKGIADDIASLFAPLAREKKLDFTVSVDKDLPVNMYTDRGRLSQILKNFLSNAIKFTASGSVSLSVNPVKEKAGWLSFSVRDSGIGIPENKQEQVFEAFQQADGSTKRKYGGTGLGLSISKQLSGLLGGEIKLESEPRHGSEFILEIPVRYNEVKEPKREIVTDHFEEADEKARLLQQKKDQQYVVQKIPESVPDDRATINAHDRCLLIIEDDTAFAKALLEYTRRQGYKGLVSVRGDEGVELARKFNPAGILLDIQLPVKSGWQVLDDLKNDTRTRHIPIHMMSSLKMKNESLQRGAIDFIDKPLAAEGMQEMIKKIEFVLSRSSRKVSIIEDNPKHAKALAYFLETFKISSELRTNASEGIAALKDDGVDCVILDMGIPDQKTYDLLESAKKDPALENMAIIIFTGKSLSKSEETRIRQYADSIIVKTAHSYKRMLDEVSLFLHIVEESHTAKEARPTARSKVLVGMTQILQNKNVLIVDDDVRNIFSLSKTLEQYKMNVLTAENGKEALDVLNNNSGVDVVLLDMMMPELDGYDTARQIRQNRSWRNLPVIAVTAKAMVGDREKCIDAGASDYITKPVDTDQLVSLLRVWLYDQVN